MIVFSVFDIFSAPVKWIFNSVENVFFSALIALLGYIAKKYLLPWLDTTFKKKAAEYILIIADDITDELVIKYPEKEIWKFLDQAVDKLMKVCGIKEREVAERAIRASMSRKGLKKHK